MKKVLFLTVAALFISSAVFAQDWGIGPKVGVNVSNINGLYAGKAKVGVTAGIFADRMVNNWFGFQTEIMYSQQGVRKHYGNRIYVERLDYINVPAIMKFYINCGLNLQVGAQMGYLVHSKESKVFDAGRQALFNKFNVDAVIGLAYDIPGGVIIEARYNIGVTPLVKSPITLYQYGNSYKWTNGTAQLSLAYRF